jgi:hypothetical protein
MNYSIICSTEKRAHFHAAHREKLKTHRVAVCDPGLKISVGIEEVIKELEIESLKE